MTFTVLRIALQGFRLQVHRLQAPMTPFSSSRCPAVQEGCRSSGGRKPSREASGPHSTPRPARRRRRPCPGACWPGIHGMNLADAAKSMSGSAGDEGADTQRPPPPGQAGFLRLACLRKLSRVHGTPAGVVCQLALGHPDFQDSEAAGGPGPARCGGRGPEASTAKGQGLLRQEAMTNTLQALPVHPGRPQIHLRPQAPPIHQAPPCQSTCALQAPPTHQAPPTAVPMHVHQRHPGAAARCSHGRRRPWPADRSCHGGLR